MPWLQVSIEAGDLDPESLSQFFEEQGALSVTFQDAADQPLFEPKPGETPLWLATNIIALFDVDTDTKHLCQQLIDVFGKKCAERVAFLSHREYFVLGVARPNHMLIINTNQLIS